MGNEGGSIVFSHTLPHSHMYATFLDIRQISLPSFPHFEQSILFLRSKPPNNKLIRVHLHEYFIAWHVSVSSGGVLWESSHSIGVSTITDYYVSTWSHAGSEEDVVSLFRINAWFLFDAIPEFRFIGVTSPFPSCECRTSEGSEVYTMYSLSVELTIPHAFTGFHSFFLLEWTHKLPLIHVM